MSKVLITGSSDGLGLMAAQRLLAAGHAVILHARNQGRARDAMTAAPNAHGVVVGDLASIAETRGLADQANRLGPFDAVIHNAGVGDRERRIETVDGLEHIFAINVLAPYVLTALIEQPKRLIYLSSGHASRRRSRPGRPAVEAPAMERDSGVLRLQAVRRRARSCVGAALAGRALQCRRPRLGRHQDGREGRA